MVITTLASHVPMPWGNVDTDVFAAWGQWAGGIGSIAAVIVALYVITRDSRVERQRRWDAEIAERRAAEVEEEKASKLRASLARTVAGAYKPIPIKGRNPGNGREVYWGASKGITVENHGTRPILEVWVEDVVLLNPVGGRRLDGWTVDRHKRRQLPVRQPVMVASLIGPGDSADIGGLKLEDAENADWDSGHLQVTISFLDVDGYRWRRTDIGTPIDITEEGPPLAANVAPDFVPPPESDE